MGPLRGDGNLLQFSIFSILPGREDGSPSWGRKLFHFASFAVLLCVEKMGSLRGDGNSCHTIFTKNTFNVEKMGPLRGDGNVSGVGGFKDLSE